MKKIFVFTLLLCLSLIAVAQPAVKGHVSVQDEKGTLVPLSEVAVFWVPAPGTENRTVLVYTGQDGSFSLPQGDTRQLVASFMGFQNDTLTLSQEDLSKPVSFVLIPLASELDAATVLGRQQSNYISKMAPVKTEVITAAGLCKMACCNLAESFENSASVTVGYSDAVTGARQIRLLGLSGSYTQMLDENRPTMRGILAPFGLSYVPGQWLESIQIAKGTGSVVNGYEAITGQINLEHRKPTTEMPFFMNLFLSQTLRSEANVASSLQLNDKLSTVVLAHVSMDPMQHDMNGDGFLDEPLTQQYNVANRWLYMAPGGAQLRFGFRGIYENRKSGQKDYDWVSPGSQRSYDGWGSNIINKGLNGYVKLGIPLVKEHSEEEHANEPEGHVDPNIAFVLDYTYHNQDAYFGLKDYAASQQNVFANAIFMSSLGELHKITLGLAAQLDFYDELVEDRWTGIQHGLVMHETHDLSRTERVYGAYGEYTLHVPDKFMLMAGVRADYNSLYGWMFTPKVNVKYNFTDDLIFRASAGKGYRSPNLIADNIGVMSTGRRLDIAQDLTMESAWTYGLNLTLGIPFGYDESTSLSVDYFRTDFANQIIVDQEYMWQQEVPAVYFYNLDGRSFTNTWQGDFTIAPFKGFTVLATFRYTDAKVTLKGGGLVDRPLTSKYKGVLNLQYATNMNIWTFDFTAQLNGPARIPDFALAYPQVAEVASKDGYSPVFPMFFAQITRKFKGVDVYVGGENLLNYRQPYPILSADDPYSPQFNATAIWGPLMGVKVYAGMRLTIWK